MHAYAVGGFVQHLNLPFLAIGGSLIGHAWVGEMGRVQSLGNFLCNI